ncbi:actin-associated protein FAM107A-like [Salarias fasciatus]|uniref:actin-associated protein FAM107A-like n=1 Tax=Salarias fasciatus TaxID=181472 RepID=UPI0011766646|nr:actin-associated protein FAM107A-like [Salarias fasciatus]
MPNRPTVLQMNPCGGEGQPQTPAPPGGGPSSIGHGQRTSSSRARGGRPSERDDGLRADVSSGPSNPTKTSRTHNQLHKELLLAHKKGLALSSRSELQQVLERRKRVQSDQTTERQSRTPLEDELLRRQQKQQKELQHPEEGRAEAQLMEFVRVRQNLRKIHSVIQDKAANP